MPAGTSTRSVSPIVSSVAATSSGTPDRRRSSVSAPRRRPAAMSRFCSTVSSSNTVAVWNVRPTPSRAIRCTFWPTSSCPPNRADPVAFTSPVTASISVVLPAPFGPMRNRRSPGSTDRFTESTATNPSKETVRSVSSR